MKKNHLSGHMDWELPALWEWHSQGSGAGGGVDVPSEFLSFRALMTWAFYSTHNVPFLAEMLYFLKCKVRSVSQPSYCSSLYVFQFCLAFLENKNCASYSECEKGLDTCGAPIFPVTCWLSFPFFQCPSSPPTLNCPQTSSLPLWVLTWQSGEMSSLWYRIFSGLFPPKRTAALSKVFQN